MIVPKVTLCSWENAKIQELTNCSYHIISVDGTSWLWTRLFDQNSNLKQNAKYMKKNKGKKQTKDGTAHKQMNPFFYPSH